MVMSGQEKDFPRGGKKPAVTVPKKGSFSLFGKQSLKKSQLKHAKKTKEKKKDSTDFSVTVSQVQPLSSRKMVMSGQEKDFPRGGKKPAFTVPKKGSFSLFGKQSLKKYQLKHPKKTKEKKKDSTDSSVTVSQVQPLSNRTLKEGMLVLGCVRSIQEYSLSVSLPGKLVGTVSITSISGPYTKSIQSLMEESSATEKVPTLNEMFHVGQSVVTRVIETGEKVKLSIAPEVVQSDWSVRSLTLGSVIVAAVRSQEENGYVMETGIKNARAFLKTPAAKEYEKMWNDEKPLSIGQVVRCVVTKSNITASVATVELSADPRKLRKALSKDEDDINLDTLLPGTVFTASILKVLKNGLEVDCQEYFTGYIHEDHLTNMWDTAKNYSFGDQHQAVLLYILPTVKLIFLSLRKDLCSYEPPTLPFNDVKIGDVLKKAQVEKATNNGVILRLHKQFKGFAPLHHCPHSKAMDSDETVLDKRLENGSTHKCRVLGYDYFTQIFICTLKKNMIKAEFLQPADLKPGMKVMCQIEKFVSTGALVLIDASETSITAFVRSQHLGNIPLTNPEKKFPVGSQHPARVLLVQGNNVQLTLKSKLVESKAKPLCSFDDVKNGMKCEGVVMLKEKNGMLITFYGSLQGWLKLDEEEQKKSFFVGQMVKCYAHEIDAVNKKLYLGLKPKEKEKGKEKEKEKKKQEHKFEVGTAYKLRVTKCTERDLKVTDGSSHGIIPAQHLTDNPTLADLLLQTYSPQNEVDCVCFNNKTNPPIFTVKPSLIKYFKREGARRWVDLKYGDLIPCTVKSINDKHVVLQLALKNCTTRALPVWELHNPKEKGRKLLELLPHQSLISRVVEGKKDKTKRITIRLKQCWDFTEQPAISRLSGFWKDYDRIARHMKKIGSPLAGLKPGDQVKGEVVAVNDQGAVINLDCEAQGIVMTKLCKKQLERGANVDGTVIFVDYQKGVAELAIRDPVVGRINPVQDGKLSEGLGVGVGVRGELLTVRPELVIIVLKGVGRQQLAYIPVQRHMNDLTQDLSKYKVGYISKMIVKAITKRRIICVLQRYEFELIKLRARVKVEAEYAKKRKTESSLNEGEPPKKKQFVSNGNLIRISKSEQDSKPQLEDSSDEEEAVIDENQESSDDEVEVTHKHQESSDEEEAVIDENQESSDDEEEVIHEHQESSDEEHQEFSEGEAEESMAKEEFLESSSVQEELLDEKVPKHEVKKRKNQCEEEVADKNLNKRKKIIAKKEGNETVKDVPRLSLSGGFVWGEDPSLLEAVVNDNKSDDSSDDEDTKKDRKKKKMTRAERRALARQEEEELRAMEQKLADSDRGPQSADDFDRLVLSSPDSSLCWIKYMAFHLQATEIEKARAVAQRALNTISFREEKEKLNVWGALLNLENLYGTKESLEKTLEEALRMNDPYKTYIRMLQIYVDSNKAEEAEKLVGTITKKFRDNKETWLQCGEMLLKLGKLEKSRSLMQRALTSLDKKFHVEVISKFAQFENRFGEPERAQTLMEHILTSYPKRTDIWKSYVDMLVKNGQLESARQVLERGIAQKLQPRKMKTLFSKFLQFEETHGTPEGAARVKQMALDYVSSSAGAPEEDET